MFRFTILQKLLLILALGIVIFLISISFGYFFTKNSSVQIEELKNNKYPASLVHSANVNLFENMVTLFSESAMTFEIDTLQKVKEKKEAILQNLETLKNYEDNTIEIQLLEDYYQYATKFTKELIENEKENIDVDSIILLQKKKEEALSYFIKRKENASEEFDQKIENISSNTEIFFSKLVLLSCLGLFIIMSISLYLYLSLKGRFTKVISMMENLATNEPDFSKNIEKDTHNDELTILIKWFNQFQTKLKNDYNLLNILKLKAEETAKMKAEFLANMSHEIRTPINGIIGMTHLLKETALTVKQKKYVENIEHSSTSLLRIINDILDFSKIESGKMNIDTIDFDLRKLLSNVISVIEFQAKKKKLSIDIVYGKNIEYSLHGDSLRISQILINLLSNAVKFTEEGSITIEVLSINTHFTFKVIDTGIGMTHIQQKNLFGAFSQADGSTTRKYGGTGLGLSISKQLVELMGGEIKCVSQKDKGSTFSFDLTLLTAKNKMLLHQKEVQQLENRNDLEGIHILLAEDNTINQEIIIGLLEKSKIAVDIATNGKEVVEIFSNNSSKYELILMDLHMPIMDGFEATQQIRKTPKGKNIPIIALTANAMQEDIEKTQKAGMNEHLNKPIEVEKLWNTLLKYLSQKVEQKSSGEKKDTDTDTVIIPKFIHIDTKIGLHHMGGNKKLYLKILQNFYTHYKDLKLENLSTQELKSFFHTIKGLSANIGALELSEISQKIEKTLDKDLFPLFYKSLQKVTNELKDVQEYISGVCLGVIDEEKRDELFASLKVFTLKKRAHQCQKNIKELKQYTLKSDDEILLNRVQELLDQREYKKIIEIL